MSKHDRKLWKENNIKTLFLWVLYKETIVKEPKKKFDIKNCFLFPYHCVEMENRR